MGKRGEIITKKSLREVSGIQPGDNIIIEAEAGQLTIRKVLSIDDILDKPPIQIISQSQLEKELDEEGKRQEELVD